MKESVLSPSARQVRAARTLLGLTQAQLASLAGLATRTIENFESESAEPSTFTVLTLKVALESAGVAFANDGAESVALQRPLEGRPPGAVLH